jgi:hypothetical protein
VIVPTFFFPPAKPRASAIQLLACLLLLSACSEDAPAPEYTLDGGGVLAEAGAALDASPAWDAMGWGDSFSDGGPDLDGAAPQVDASSDGGTFEAGSTDAGGSDAGSDGGVAPAESSGCASTKLYELPANTAERGPWPVGVKTVQLPIATAPGQLTFEVWYPATRGSELGKTRKEYDLRDFLKPSQRMKVPAEKARSEALICNCYADLPIDAAHGPYPVVFYIHGTAAMRIASGHTMAHWASRGFVVVAADHPGMYLADMLALAGVADLCFDTRDPQDVPRDIDVMLAGLKGATGGLAFLKDHIDLTRVGMTGHSQGAGLAAQLADREGVQISIPLSGSRAIVANDHLKSSLYYGGMDDAVLSYESQKSAYTSSPAPKRLVGVKNAGHLLMTDLCGGKNVDGKDSIEVARDYKVCGIGLAGGLWDCKDTYISQAKGTEITNYVTTAALEETLFCQDRKASFAELKSRYTEVGELAEQLQ